MCFYRAIALWRNETSDEKNEEIHRLSSSLIENFQRFLSRYYFLQSLWESTFFKIYYDAYEFAPANHFNLLLPRGSCLMVLF